MNSDYNDKEIKGLRFSYRDYDDESIARAYYQDSLLVECRKSPLYEDGFVFIDKLGDFLTEKQCNDLWNALYDEYLSAEHSKAIDFSATYEFYDFEHGGFQQENASTLPSDFEGGCHKLVYLIEQAKDNNIEKTIKENWKKSVEIDDDETANILYDDYQTHDDNGKEIMQKGLDVHFNISDVAVAKMIDTYNMQDMRVDILLALSEEEHDGYADLYVTFFDRNHIDATLVITDNDKKMYIDNADLNAPDLLKQALIEKVEEYHDMTLEEVMKHAALDIEYEE